MKYSIKYFALFLIIFSCSKVDEGVVSENAMVVSAREEASKIGIKILKKGGNAFDAMMATELALAVSYPSAGNIGGGGFMVYRMSDGTIGALDYRERAPIKSSRDMYLDDNGNIIVYQDNTRLYNVGRVQNSIAVTIKTMPFMNQRRVLRKLPQLPRDILIC